MPQGYRDALRLLLNGTNIYAEVFPYADVNSGTPLHMLAKWDGNSWSILAAASFNPLSGLAFAQDTLYASGSLYVPGSQSPLALGRLIQTNWVPVGGGVGDDL